MLKNKTTLREIANRAGLSIITVSRALNNHPRVRKGTRDLVLKIANEMGYTPNFNARALASGSSNTFGVIIPDNANPFFAKVVRGIEETARRKGYMVILCNTNEDKEQEKVALEMLRQKRIDGLLVTPSQFTSTHLELIQEQRIPFVLLNRYIPGFDSDCVVNDNYQGAFDATSYLCNLGHSRIVHITGSEAISSVRERLNGYREALEVFGIVYDPNLIVRTDLKLESSYKKILRILSKSTELPTAIFAYSDFLAFGALKALREVNLRVPDDVSLVGYDNIDYSSYVCPSLTTVSQAAYEIGSEGVNLLIERLSNDPEETYWIPRRIVYTPQLTIRESCKAINK